MFTFSFTYGIIWYYYILLGWYYFWWLDIWGFAEKVNVSLDFIISVGKSCGLVRVVDGIFLFVEVMGEW